MTTSSGTERTISGRTSREVTAPSTWRPPWFDTTIPSTPMSAHKRASDVDRIPLTIRLPFQKSRASRMWSHVKLSRLAVSFNTDFDKTGAPRSARQFRSEEHTYELQ